MLNTKIEVGDIVVLPSMYLKTEVGWVLEKTDAFGEIMSGFIVRVVVKDAGWIEVPIVTRHLTKVC